MQASLATHLSWTQSQQPRGWWGLEALVSACHFHIKPETYLQASLNPKGGREGGREGARNLAVMFRHIINFEGLEAMTTPHISGLNSLRRELPPSLPPSPSHQPCLVTNLPAGVVSLHAAPSGLCHTFTYSQNLSPSIPKP